MKFDNYFREYWFAIVGLIAWVIAKGRFGMYQIDKATFIIGSVAVGIMLAKDFLAREQLRTPHLVASGLWGSVWYPPQRVGMWTVRTLGDVKFLGIRGKTVFVYPTICEQSRGDCVNVNVMPRRLGKEYLPLEVQEKLLEISHRPDRIYMGIVPEQWILQNKDWIIAELQYNRRNVLVSTQDKIIDGKQGAVEGAIGSIARMRDDVESNLKNKIKRALQKQRGEEDE